MPLIEVDGCTLNVAIDGEEHRPALMLSNSMGCTLETDAAHISNFEQATKFTSAMVEFLSEQ